MNGYDHVDHDDHIDDPQSSGDSFNSVLFTTVIFTNTTNDDNDGGW